MGKKLFKKLLSGAAASMMIFGASPRSNTKAATSSWSAKDTATVAIAGGVLVTIGVVGGVIAYFEKKHGKMN